MTTTGQAVSSGTFDLSGRAALITGAASGIGRAIALVVAAHGADIAAIDLASADPQATLDAIGKCRKRAVFTGADVTSPEQMRNAVAHAEEELGPLTLAVNAAGIANACPAEWMPLEQWQRVYDVDVTGVFVSCPAEANAMLRHGRGSIVNISSMSGTIVNRGLLQCHYNSAKAASYASIALTGNGMGPSRDPRQRAQPWLHGHTHEPAP